MRLIKAVFLIVFLAVAVAAQADYLSSVKVSVDDVPADKVSFKVDRMWNNGMRETHRVWNVIQVEDANVVHLGLEERGTFLISVSAEGFKPFEFKVFFAAGHMQTAAVKLGRIGSPAEGSVRRLTKVVGQVVDPAGALITTAKIVFQGKQFGRFEAATTNNGVYELLLPYDAFFRDEKAAKWEGDPYSPTRYSMTVTAPGFRTFRIDDLVVTNPPRGSTDLDVVMELQNRGSGRRGDIIQKWAGD